MWWDLLRKVSGARGKLTPITCERHRIPPGRTLTHGMTVEARREAKFGWLRTDPVGAQSHCVIFIYLEWEIANTISNFKYMNNVLSCKSKVLRTLICCYVVVKLAWNFKPIFVCILLKLYIFIPNQYHEENAMDGVLGHLCAHIGWTGPGELPEDGEMNEMTLPSWHRIRNSSPGGLMPSTLPLGHGSSPQYWIFTNEQGRNICFFETWRAKWGLNPRSPTFQAGSFNHCTRASRANSKIIIMILYTCTSLPYWHWRFKER